MARARDYLSLVKFSHSVFALPFALIAVLVATQGRPGLTRSLLIVLAMVCARTAAMAYNRFADRDLDARNPRTQNRELPRGVVRPRQALMLTVLASLGFVAAAAGLGTLCLSLSLPVLAVLLGYSHAKRFTAFAHAWLGIALGLAPPAAWLAVTGAVDARLLAAVVLGVGVTLWVAGFDILYACQDVDFDRAEGLHSWPSRVGIAAALTTSRGLHVGAVAAFAAFGRQTGLGTPFYLGVGAAALLLAYEHWLVRPHDLSRMNAAFFTMNGFVGLTLLSATALALYM